MVGPSVVAAAVVVGRVGNGVVEVVVVIAFVMSANVILRF